MNVYLYLFWKPKQHSFDLPSPLFHADFSLGGVVVERFISWGRNCLSSDGLGGDGRAGNFIAGSIPP